MKRYHVAVAAEAYAAALFARCGYEVSVQYGANQPGYDLMVVRDQRILKISVKGSSDGGWGLLASHKKGKSWHQAIDSWLSAQPDGAVMCFVQFKNVAFNELPRIYLARTHEVAILLKTGRGNEGSTMLLEDYHYKKGIAKGIVDQIPSLWKATGERVESV